MNEKEVQEISFRELLDAPSNKNRKRPEKEAKPEDVESEKKEKRESILD